MVRKKKMCIDCRRHVIHPRRPGNVCLDCLIIRIATVLPPTKRTMLLKGMVFEQEAPELDAQEKAPEGPTSADP